jgi:hypothetical protein
MNLRYDPGERTQLRASWGRFYQAQGINELQVEDGIETFYPAQRADHLILSAEHALPNQVEYGWRPITRTMRSFGPALRICSIQWC